MKMIRVRERACFIAWITNIFLLLSVAVSSEAYAQHSDTMSESLYAGCLRKLPKTLKLPAKAPETMRMLVPKENFLTDYEPLIGGVGWGASLKYRNTSCEVVVYAYDKGKASLTDKEAQTERQLFDGFPSEGVFEKEVGDFTFYGTAGIAPLDTSDKQVQMFSVAAVHNTFIKYRTVCRHLVDLPDESNYRVADLITSQVIKETLIPLDNCLIAEKAAQKMRLEEN